MRKTWISYVTLVKANAGILHTKNYFYFIIVTAIIVVAVVVIVIVTI